jgi:hypothetical protein
MCFENGNDHRLEPCPREWHLPRPARLGATTLALLLGGCVTDAEFLQQNSASALRTAEARGKFELNCEAVRTTVLSQKVVQGIQGYGWRGAGVGGGPWTEYTVGVRGCGREVVYMAVCRDENNCNAFSQTANVLNTPPGPAR